MNKQKAVRKIFLRTGKWAIVLLLLSVLFVQQSVFAAAGNITGVVYRDYNADGTKQPLEPGIAGVIVTAYDGTGASAVDATDDDGLYDISHTFAGNDVRVEFTLPSNGSLDFLQPGAAGNTTVQFVDISSGGTVNGLDVGFNNPAQYSQSDPELFTPIYIEQDNITGPNNAESVSGAVAYSANSIGPTITRQVPAAQMGATYGVAWQAASGSLFTSSYIKNGVGLGPNGSGGTTTGGIYLVSGTGTNATATLFMDLQTTLSLGTDPHPASGTTCTSALTGNTDNEACWYHDSGAFSTIGKMGLGDLDFNSDQTLLYTVDMTNRQLVEIPVGNPAVAPAPGAIVRYAIPTNACANADDARPFALASYDDDADKMYVGVTCTGQTSQQASDMLAVVYEFDRNSGGSFNSIFSHTLQYNRERSIGDWGQCSHGGGNCKATWRPWVDSVASMNIVEEQANGKLIAAHPQPMLSDIAFDNGDLLLAVRDRVADMFGSALGHPTDNTNSRRYDSWAAGDLLRACDDGAGGWTMEINAVCGGVTGGGQNNTQGYDNGEYYFDQITSGAHSEIFLGGLVQIPGFPSVAATVYDGTGEVETGDIATWINNTGLQDTGARLYKNSSPNFGKANGLGDLEPLRDPAPIELGNRVWEDTDGDGIQDPGEVTLSGVPVALWVDTDDDGTVDVVAATTTTDGNGRYLFSKHGTNSLGQTETWVDTSAVVDRYTAYELRIALSDVGGRNLTARSSDGQIDNNSKEDLRDSDATLVSGTTAVILFTTGGAGYNNHSLDFGFTPLSAGSDYGDLPNSFDTNTPSGPVHTITPNLYLGNCVDAETNGQPSDRAGVDGIEGDDNSISGAVTGACSGVSDEDGVELLTPLIPGEEACVSVTAVNNLGYPANFYGFIDYNGDGDFDGDTEELITGGDFGLGAAILPDGGVTDTNYCFNVPSGATFEGGETHLRFRLTSDPVAIDIAGGDTPWRDPASDGEVEDYYTQLACVGNYVWKDLDGDGVQDGSESGINGVDVSLVWLGMDNSAGGGDDVSYTVTTEEVDSVNGKYSVCGLIANNSSGNGGSYRTEITTFPAGLDLTIPNNGSSDYDDSDGTQASPGATAVGPDFTIASVNSLTTAENSIGDTLHVNNFPNNQDDLSFDYGFAGYDYGDLPSNYNLTTGADNGARHTLDTAVWLGACVDTEVDGQSNATATGDDGANSTFRTDGICSAGDEDGVTVPGVSDPKWDGANADLAVGVSGDACLNIWIDYGDGGVTTNSLPNGNFNDPGEHVLVNQPVDATTPSVSVSIPDWAFDPSYSGNRQPYLRARLTPRDADTGCDAAEAYGGTASPSGPARGGEVEDYRMGFSPTAVNLQSFSANNNIAGPVGLVIVLSLILIAGSFIILHRRKAAS